MESFISNLNAAGRAAAAEEAKKSALYERIDDALSIIGDKPLVVCSWGDSSRCPNSTVPYTSIMIYPESEKLSTLMVSQTVNGNQLTNLIPLEGWTDEVKELAKAIVFPTVKYYLGEADGVTAFVGEIVAYDTGTGQPIIKAISGRQEGEEFRTLPVAKNSPAILLSEVPEVHEHHYPANVFILESNCPALRKDAMRGDVFAFDGTFHKCYTFDEKVAAVRRQPEKLIPLPDSDIKSAVVFMTKDLSIVLDDENAMEAYMTDNHIEHMYLLLLDNGTVTVPATTGNNAKPEQVTVYEKGSFLYIENSPSFKITKVPFDLFFR